MKPGLAFIILVLGCIVDGIEFDEIIACEPANLRKQVPFWMDRYDMKRSPTGFISKIVHLSRYNFPFSMENRTYIEAESGITKGHHYIHTVTLKKTNHLVAFKQANFELTYNFHHGDTVIIHMIDPDGTLLTDVLGFHVGKYFAVIKRGVWYAFEFPKHNNENYALLGVTSIRTREHSMDLKVPGADILSKMFPQHEEIIRRLA